MKKLLLAASLAAVLAAPAFAQPAPTDQNGPGEYSAPRAEAQNVTPYGYAPASQATAVPGETTSAVSSRQAYRDSTSNPAHWKASNPFNYEVGGG